MEAASPEGRISARGSRRFLAILIVGIVVAAVTGVTIVIYGSLNKRVGVSYESTLTQLRDQALIDGVAERSPIIIEVNTTAFAGNGRPTLCSLDVEKERVHEGECERFRYEYRYQESVTGEITFALRLTLGLNRTQSTLKIAVSAEGAVSVARQENVALQSESWRIVWPSTPSVRSADTGTSTIALSWSFDLASGGIATNSTLANRSLWVNITVNVTISFTITINTLVVVEGDCRGFITTHYHWAEASAEFRVEVELEAQEEAANGTVLIVSR